MNLLIEPDELETHLDDPDVVIVDLCKPTQYAQAHIKGALHLGYEKLIHIEKPVMGLLPSAEDFSETISELGIGANSHVIAYDDEGGGRAARFIWTLHVFGHNKTSLLNGGLFSWANEGHPLSNETPDLPTPSNYTIKNTDMYTTDREYINQNLDNENVVLLDARSLAEYTGAKKFAQKGGHIPGAVHYEWTDAMERNNNLRLLHTNDIQKKMDEMGIDKNKEVICYCQSHHRSAFSYLMLRILGYENVKGYPGSWSDWGNDPDTPVD
jgi:thiosulfate/3-mercaptopyruvate sulfurtransferase